MAAKRVAATKPEGLVTSLLLLTTGGTIAGRVGAAGVTPVVAGGELGAALAEHVDATVVTEELFQLPSAALTIEQMLTIARRVRVAVREEGHHGVIITHGTDTVADTAWLTHLVVGERPCRVAFATAMRNGDEIGADGLRNLIDSARVVGTEAAPGVVLVANGEIHAGCWVRKERTTALQAFGSPGHGPIGDLFGDEPLITQSIPLAPNLPAADPAVAAVAVVPTWDEHGSVTIPALLAARAAGLVLEGSGAGNLHPECATAVDAALAQGASVVVVSRADGPTHHGYGGVAGSGRWIAERAILDGGALGASRARIALALALGCLPRDVAESWFEQVVAAQRGRQCESATAASESNPSNLA